MPWGRLDDSLYDHPKLDRIPAAERLAAIGLWARAISWCNRFLTDGHMPRTRVDRLDGSQELAQSLVVAGLFEETATGYVIHDFLEFNDSREQVMERRAKEAARKAEWRANRRPTGTDGGTGNARETSPSGTHHGTTANGEHDVPGGVPAGQGNARNGAESPVPRFPARVARSARHDANPDPTRPDPTHESLREENRRARPSRRADVQALYDRGWKRVTKAQRRVLDEVLGRHDLTGPAFAAEAIRRASPEKDPLEAVMAADRAWQDAQRRRAEAEETTWQATKDADREEAAGISWLRGPGGAES